MALALSVAACSTYRERPIYYPVEVPPPRPQHADRRAWSPVPKPEPRRAAPLARTRAAKPRARYAPLRGVAIVVDAGHGGRDPGATGAGPMPEEYVNLNIAIHLARSLRACGAEVIMTRNSDRFVSLDDRAAAADRTRADLFVSIHADAARRSSATGATIYIARNASRDSRRAARHIETAMKRADVGCRGVRRAGFRVLVGHSRPAVLVECGFLTNPVEARRLGSPWYQARMAAVIAQGITNHFGS